MKQVPHAINIERSVLASCMIDPDTADNVLDSLDKNVFYRTAHRRYFEAMQILRKKDAPADLSSVSQVIQDKGWAEVAPISELAEIMDHPVSTSIDHHIRVLREKFALRAGIEICNAALKRFYAGDEPVEAIEYAKSAIDKLDIEGDIDDFILSMRELLGLAVERIDLASIEGDKRLRTGYHNIDEVLKSLKPGLVTFLAARPSMGKTAFAINIMIRTEEPAAFFSLEQTKDELTERMIAIKAKIDLTKLQSGRLSDDEWDKVEKASGALDSAPFYIDDTPSLTTQQILARARKLKRKFGIKIVYVDYLQLVKGDHKGENKRYLEVAQIAKDMKMIAKKLEIPVVCISQLNRNLENRPNPNKRPKLSDLRESGEIEQIADAVVFLYRPEIYDDDTSVQFPGQNDINVAKQRQGPCGTKSLLFLGEYVSFENPDLYFHDQQRGAKNEKESNSL